MRPSILRARIVLFVAVVVVAIAQQVDYNTQVRNRPVTHVVATGQTLASAVAALPAGGVLTIPSGTYTISTTISVPQNNVTFQCQPGAQINAGANNIETFDITGAGVRFTGCLFDGNSHTGVRFLTADGVTSDNFTATWNTFQNDDYIGGSYSYGVQAFGGSKLTLNHNRYLNIGGGVFTQNVDEVTIEDETCNGILDLDCIGGSVAYGTFTNGASAYINNIRGDSLARFGVELTEFGYRSIVVSNISFVDISGDCISVVTDNGSSPSQSLSTIINSASCQGNSSVTSAYAIEASGKGLVIKDNSITGPFSTGIEWNGAGATIADNTITGISGGFAIQSNPCCVIHDSILSGNTTTNAKDGGIAPGADCSGCIFRNNHDFRAPGYWVVTDSAQIYSAISGGVVTARNPMLIEGNSAVVLTPVNAYAMPGTMLWSCLRTSNTNSAASPATFRDNTCENRNATAFGQVFYGGTDAWYANINLLGNKYINLAAPAGGTSYSTSAAINYRDNQTLAGLGGAPYTDFTIATLTYAKRGGALNGSANYFTDGACTAGTLAGSGSGSSGRLTNGSWTCP